MAQRIEAGMIMLNCGISWDPAMPFGGHKQSGWGYENGQEGLEGYLKTKTVLAQICCDTAAQVRATPIQRGERHSDTTYSSLQPG